MWLIAETPITVRTAQGDVRLTPGVPHELPDCVGQRVIEQAGSKVRVHQPEAEILIEPAAPDPRPVYWRGVDGKLCGPAKPELLAKVGTGTNERFWVVVTYQGTTRWVRANRLQAKPKATRAVGSNDSLRK
ncbi:MAG: hypothetical protein NW202_13065 [Nitrospira sp.]|nr:hypothetical protein [Nitrospira sp.]